MYSVVNLKSASTAAGTEQKWGYARRLGYALIQETKVEIGGSKIDEQYGDWLNIWQELTIKAGQVRGHAAMIGDVHELKHFNLSHDSYDMFGPLGYWFNRHNGLALPLIALQYHDVRITIQYANSAQCVNWDRSDAGTFTLPVSMDDSYLLIDYVYLDSEERKRFAQASHEYLIEQLQFTGSESLTSTSNKYRLNFNHPSKFLIWVPHLQKYNTHNEFLAYADDGDWAAAKEKAAKLIWMASRDLSSGDLSGNTVYYHNSTTESHPEMSARADMTELLASLAEKVDAQFMFTEFVTNSGSVTAYPAVLDNCVVLKNELSSEDVSNLVFDITSGDATAEGVISGVAGHSVFVIDTFNYGRWLDRTVNPVSSGKLQWLCNCIPCRLR
jgi:hypothetical protein